MDSYKEVLMKDEHDIYHKHLKDKNYETFAIMLYGSQNYELETEESDIDSKLMVIPSVKDVILGKKKLSTEYETSKGLSLTQDYRLMFNSYYKGNINFVETLFTKYYIINPSYKEEFADLRAHRDLIANSDPVALVKMATGMAQQKYAAMEHEFPTKVDVIKKYGYDPKQLHHLMRLTFFVSDYLIDLDFGKSLVPHEDEKAYLKTIKTNPVPLDEARRLADYYLSYLTDKKKFVEENPEYYPNKKDEVKEYLDNLAVRVFNKSLRFAQQRGEK